MGSKHTEKGNPFGNFGNPFGNFTKDHEILIYREVKIMANNTSHSYNISLDITSPQASKQALKEMQTSFENSNQSVEDLNKTYLELAKNTEDVTELERQYDKIVSKRLNDYDRAIDKLEAEKVAIAANRDLTEEQRKEQIKIRDAQIKNIKNEKNIFKAKEKEAKLLAKMNKTLHTNLDENSKAFKLAKSAVSLQEKLNNLLGKESKLRKAASKAAAAGAKVAKVGAKAMGGALAIGGALAGAAAATAGDIANKEQSLKSLKSGIDPSVVDAIYIKSGADYSSIVAAVNNLSDVTKDNGLLVQGAVLELQNPGVGKMLLSTSKQDPNNIAKLNNAIAQIKRQTGTQDLSAALEASTKARSVTTGQVSQTEYIQAYSALAQQGIDEETINRIIRTVSAKGGNFIDNLNNTNLAAMVHDKQLKTRLTNASLGLEKLDFSKESERSSAQSVVEKLREFELKKNELLIKMLPVVDRILEEVGKVINSPAIDKIAHGLVNLFSTVIPLLDPILTALQPILDLIAPVLEWLTRVANDFVATVVTPIINKLGSLLKSILPESWTKNTGGVSGGAHALGGIVNAPSIVGEAGPELVLPLTHDKAGRASQIIQNFNTNQSFNMSNNQTTPLAFASAIGNNRFIKRAAGV